MTDKIKNIVIEEEGDLSQNSVQYDNLDARLQSSIDMASYLVQNNATDKLFKEAYYGYTNYGTGTTETNRIGMKSEYLVNIQNIKTIVANNQNTTYDFAIVFHSNKIASSATQVYDSGWITSSKTINVSAITNANFMSIRFKHKDDTNINLSEVETIDNMKLYLFSNVDENNINIDKLLEIINDNIIDDLKADLILDEKGNSNYASPGDSLRTRIQGLLDGQKELGINFSRHLGWPATSSAGWRNVTYPITLESSKVYKIKVELLEDNEQTSYNVFLMKDTTMNSSSIVKSLGQVTVGSFSLTATQAEEAKYVQIRSAATTTLKGSFNLKIYSINEEDIQNLKDDIEIIGNNYAGRNFVSMNTATNAISNSWSVSNGKLVINSYHYYYKITYLEVNANENYIISSYYGANQYNVPYIITTDDELNIITQYNTNSSRLTSDFISNIITIPQGATRLYMGQYGNEFIISAHKCDLCKYSEKINENSLDLMNVDLEKIKDLKLEPIQQVNINWPERESAGWNQSYAEIIWDITKDAYLYFVDIPDSELEIQLAYGIEKNINSSNIKHKILQGENITKNYLKLPGWTYTGEGTIQWMVIYANTTIEWITNAFVFQNGIFYHLGTVEEEISNMEDDIGILMADPETLLPNYYFTNNYLYNKIDEVKENILESENAITFTFATDLHFPANTGNSKYMIKTILDKTLVPFALFGGDYPGAYGVKADVDAAANKWLEYVNYLGRDKCFSVQGNHDWTINHNNVEGETGFTAQNAYIYNYLGRSIEAYVGGLEYPNLYYYIDIPAQKTRIFMLNSCNSHSTTETEDWGTGFSVGKVQIQWLINKINEVQNYNFIAIAHVPGDSNFVSGYNPSQLPLQNLFVALKNKTTYSESIDGETITANFSSSTNDIACFITGHTHYDQSHVNNNLLNIGVTCDAAYNDDQWAPATRGTIKENAFDVFTVDFTNKTIKTVRFGRGENRNWTFI